MTKKRQLALQRYIDGLKSGFGIDSWTIAVSDESPEDSDAAACVGIDFGRKSAVMGFRADFFEQDPRYQRHVLVHELVHLIHAEEESLIFEILPNHMRPHAGDLFIDVFRQTHEYAIDHLATLVAQFIEPPEFS